MSNILADSRALLLGLVVGVSALGILKLYGEWKIESKVTTATLLILLMFSVLTATSNAQYNYITIDNDLINAVKWVDSNVPENASVGSYQRAEVVSFVTGTDTITDEKIADYLVSNKSVEGYLGLHIEVCAT